ncbi:MAG: hypothetical protein GY696_23965, partial [Gammaproteobacteria bacterium]|nr:hypothetical protein [Gammaproteobacteria bacterium]
MTHQQATVAPFMISIPSPTSAATMEQPPIRTPNPYDAFTGSSAHNIDGTVGIRTTNLRTSIFTDRQTEIPENKDAASLTSAYWTPNPYDAFTGSGTHNIDGTV